LHLRHIYPLPANFTELVKDYEKILVPELNQGQLAKYIQAEISREVISFSKVTGQPFTVDEIKERIVGLEDTK
jgi:2-oxoglutarate ferredoxin oxidoreductase subunit alpha